MGEHRSSGLKKVKVSLYNRLNTTFSFIAALSMPLIIYYRTLAL